MSRAFRYCYLRSLVCTLARLKTHAEIRAGTFSAVPSRAGYVNTSAVGSTDTCHVSTRSQYKPRTDNGWSSRRPLEQRLQCLSFFNLALGNFQEVTRPADQSRQAKKCCPVDQQNPRHARIKRSPAADYRGGMLCAEKPYREVNQRDIQGSEDRHHGGNQRGLAAR